MLIPFQLPFLALNSFSSIFKNDHLSTARSILSKHPLIDTHIDLPVQIRSHYRNDLEEFNYHRRNETRNVDLKRLKEGGVSGFFSIAYVPCEDLTRIPHGPNFTEATNDVRDTLEQIDVTHELVERYPSEIALADSSASFKKNFQEGKISHFIGVEGAHSLGNSLATLRIFQKLGVRYLTLTHTCHNIFADSAGQTEPLHGGLSSLGRELIEEMNRLGVMVDVSHTSDDTTRQAIQLSKAPVIFSHSGSRSIYNHPRNVPDDILHQFKEKEDGLFMVDWVAEFVKSENQTVVDVAEHVNHISDIIGRDRVGAGSDFDGALKYPVGLEDVSKYENLLVELLKSNWTTQEVVGFIGGNFLRVLEKVEKVSKEIKTKGAKSNMKARADLTLSKPWGVHQKDTFPIVNR